MDLYKKVLKEKVKQKAIGGEEVKEIEIDKLKENPYQPRIEIKEDEVKELAKSIEKNGLLQPINVYQSPLSDYYIISGHRRVEAHKLLNKKTIKAIVYKNQDDLKLASKSIVENLQRKDLSLVELALSLKRYKEEFKKTLEEVAEDIGKSKGYVSQILSILNLPEKVIKDIKENKTTKDVWALSLLNSFAKKNKKKFDMSNLDEWEDEIFRIYKGFLKNGREWLKNEINNKSIQNKKENIEIQSSKNKITIKINLKMERNEISELKKIIENFLLKKPKEEN
ncbi:ParB/RepB/Spo0J family partition protein [Caminibacter mediatlanticus]|uniref:ParB-like nuclease domain n=1 Tax=Caminibacter mediatlanticus TB-2 TaxID=391592 RepID=A0AAI9AFX3_9BACT|nr:ParB/RepB/Spo0J family partition protein [Caminibacter mediatlanticus]EDM22902.1 ParB-like nuclease domain [Caminibacter mediatlanticus TB-2]